MPCRLLTSKYNMLWSYHAQREIAAFTYVQACIHTIIVSSICDTMYLKYGVGITVTGWRDLVVVVPEVTTKYLAKDIIHKTKGYWWCPLAEAYRPAYNSYCSCTSDWSWRQYRYVCTQTFQNLLTLLHLKLRYSGCLLTFIIQGILITFWCDFYQF